MSHALRVPGDEHADGRPERQTEIRRGYRPAVLRCVRVRPLDPPPAVRAVVGDHSIRTRLTLKFIPSRSSLTGFFFFYLVLLLNFGFFVQFFSSA